MLAGLVVKFWPEPPLTGSARAVDGDTLRLGSERVRLLGIDAPELGQSCKDHAGADWPCGRAAREALVRLLAAGPTTCAPHGRDKYGRRLARCRAGEKDLGAAMVAAGLAVSYGDYSAEELAARAQGRGLWSGSFERPDRFREDERDSSPADRLLDWIGRLWG